MPGKTRHSPAVAIPIPNTAIRDGNATGFDSLTIATDTGFSSIGVKTLASGPNVAKALYDHLAVAYQLDSLTRKSLLVLPEPVPESIAITAVTGGPLIADVSAHRRIK